MSVFKIAIRSLVYYLRSNFVLALGIAAATAVLTGALIVGDSMRTSLRALALDRLGGIDQIVVSDGFFGADLGDSIAASDLFDQKYDAAVAVVLFPGGSVETNSEQLGRVQRAGGVAVFGIPGSNDGFWDLADDSLNAKEISGREVIINEALADQLGVDGNGEWPMLTLRIPKPTQLPSDSSLGKKDDLIESLVELQVVQVVPNKSVGRFALHVSQVDSPNIFMPIDLISGTLQRDALEHRKGTQANAIFLSGKGEQLPDFSDAVAVLKTSNPSLDDFGLVIKDVNQVMADSDRFVFDYYSLSSDRLVLSDEIVDVVRQAIPDAQPVFTYLANEIRGENESSGIPFSMIAGIDVGADFPLVDVNGKPIGAIGDYQIVLNEWTARELEIEVGNSVVVRYFEPESTEGSGVEKEANFTLKAITPLAKPDSGFRVRRNKVTPAQFLTNSPTLANDPDLTPAVPGLTDAESIEQWDLPFETADKIRVQDNDYWDDYRTTPKGFVSLGWAQELWGGRFGKVTSFRIPKSAGDVDEVKARILRQFQLTDQLVGFSVIPIKENAIAASSGSTPFDVLFLALSMFVVASALILVSLLIRLTLQRRAAELGTMMSVGLGRTTVGRTILLEMLFLVVVGVLVGLVLGVAYAGLMIFGLTTWWVGAISQPILRLHVSPLILSIGALAGLLVSFLTIVFTVRGTRKVSAAQMLAGKISKSESAITEKPRSRRAWIFGLLLFALILSIVASFLGGEPQAGAFMGAGLVVLAAGMLAVYDHLRKDDRGEFERMDLRSLAAMSGKRNPLRSTLTVGLVAVSSFLIVAVSSFRLSPSEAGTAGFDLMASSDGSIYERLDQSTDQPIQAFSLRFKGGEDASCNNLYQSTQPNVLAVGQDYIDSFSTGSTDFRWASVATEDLTFKKLPWNLLNEEFDDGAIPVVIDKNTANYSLKIFQTSGIYHVDFDSGQSVDFRVVGFLENSILQGSLIISESNFTKLFPEISGYRRFLIRSQIDLSAGQGEIDDLANLSSILEERFSDQGLDVKAADLVLAGFQTVQNTYISTFQTLGALGLLLGTFGLAVVQIRSVIERQKELGLMRSVGFSLGQLSRLVLMENMWLLLVGLAVGVTAALVTTLPHFLIGGASIPWLDLAVLLVLISGFGWLAAFWASRTIASLPLIESLRSGG